MKTANVGKSAAFGRENEEPDGRADFNNRPTREFGSL